MHVFFDVLYQCVRILGVQFSQESCTNKHLDAFEVFAQSFFSPERAFMHLNLKPCT